jgi:hypothetical protein
MDNRQKSTKSTLNTLRRPSALPLPWTNQQKSTIRTQHRVQEAIAALASSPTVTSATGAAEKSREMNASETQHRRNMNAKNNARITRNNAGFRGLSPESGAAYALIFREFRPGRERNSEKSHNSRNWVKPPNLALAGFSAGALAGGPSEPPPPGSGLRGRIPLKLGASWTRLTGRKQAENGA